MLLPISTTLPVILMDVTSSCDIVHIHMIGPWTAKFKLASGVKVLTKEVETLTIVD